MKVVHKMKKNWLAIVLVVGVLVILGFTIPFHSSADEQIQNKGLKLRDFSIKIDGQELVENMEINDGAKVDISFQYDIHNVDRQKEYNIDLKAKGMEIVDYPEAPLMDEANRKVGVYVIKNGMIYITLDDAFLGRSEISGYANIKGKVNVTQTGNEDMGKEEIGVAETFVDVNIKYKPAESSLYIQKETAGKAEYEKASNQVIQEYKVTLTANGKVTNIKLTDNCGSGIEKGSITDITMNGKRYPTLKDLEMALTELDSTSVSFTYKMKVNGDIYKASENVYDGKYRNTIKAEYKTSKDTPKTSESWAVYPNISKPYVSKSGQYNKDTNTVEWTISIYVGDLSKADIQNIKDILGKGLTVNGQSGEIDLKAGDFTESNGVYSYTYTTQVDEKLKDTVSPVVLNNKVNVDFGKNYGIWSADTNVTTPGIESLVQKKHITYDSETKKLTWEIDLDVPSGGLTNVELEDNTITYYPNSGNHSASMDSITIVKGNERVEVVKDGKCIRQDVVEECYSIWCGWKLKFADAYINRTNRGKTIKMICTSTITDENINGKEYTNKVTATYKDNLGNTGSSVGSASWEDANKLVIKNGYANEKQDGAVWEVQTNISKLDSVKLNDVFNFTDKLPENMELADNSVSAVIMGKQVWGDMTWNQADISECVSYKKNTDGTVGFNIKVNEAFMQKLQQVKSTLSQGQWYTIVLKYSTQVKDIQQLIKKGEVSFQNHVTGEFKGQDIGVDAATVKLHPKDVIKKTYRYDKLTAPNILYFIEVNQYGYDLDESDWLELTDTMGDALILNATDITVSAFQNNNWRVMEQGKEYFFKYNPQSNSFTMRIPDETYIRIQYSAKTNLYVNQDESKNESFTEENSYNQVKLKGYSSDQTQDKVSMKTVALTPTIAINALNGAITVYKYWNNGEQMTALPGAEFKLTAMKYNPAANTFTDDKIYLENIEIPENGTVTIDGLRYDIVYKLVETKAPDGFEKSTQAYYFVIKGSADVNLPNPLPDGMKIEQFYTGAMIYYQNKEADPKNPDEGEEETSTDQGEKPTSGEGESTSDKENESTTNKEESTSHLKPDDGTEDKTTEQFGDGTTKKPNTGGENNDGSSEENTTKNQGNNTPDVGEENDDSGEGNGSGSGKPSYTPNTGDEGSSQTEGNKNTGRDDSLFVKPTDGSEIVKAEIVLTKTIQGAVTKEEAEGALEFMVTNLSTAKSKIYTLKDFKYDKEQDKYFLRLTVNGNEVYHIEEIVTDIDGYVLTSVSSTVSASGQTKEDDEDYDDTEAIVTVGADETAQVDYKDEYMTDEEAEQNGWSVEEKPFNKKKVSDKEEDKTSNLLTNSPKTGDSFKTKFYIGLIGAAVVVLVLFKVFGPKRKEEE